MSELTDKLIESRQRAWANMQEHVQEAEKRGEWSAEDEQKFQRMNADIDALDERIKTLHNLDQRNKEMDEQRAEYEATVRSTPEPRVNPNVPQTDEDRLRAFLRGEGGRSIELGLMPERRVHTVATAASGGTTVPRSFVGELYDKLYEFSPMRQLAHHIVTDGGNPLDIPTVASAGTAAIVGEGTAISANDATFSQVSLGAWKYAKLTQISSELIADTGVDLLGYIADDAGRAIAAAQGSHFASGSGSNQPLGYGTAYPIGVTGATGGTGVPTVANLIDLFHSVAQPYRASSKCGWVMRDASAAYIRKLTAASSAPEQWAPSLQAGTPDMLLGKPVFYDPYAAAYGTPAKPISFGDWSSYVIRDAGSVRLERSDDFAFDKDLVTFRIVLRTDAKARDVNGAMGSVKHFAGPST